MPVTYAQSGVDILAEDKAIAALVKNLTYKRSGMGRPLTEIGHYAGLIDFGEYALALTTDGVGSKVLIANEMRKWDTIGIDCIAMNVNDLLAIGAEPLAFVDYIAVEKPDEHIMAEIGKGLRRGAEISRMTIVGGETASLPDMIRGLDLAGTCLGAVKKSDIITGEKIEKGDVLFGLPGSGVHSNGYSLVRKIIREAGFSYKDPFPYDETKTTGEVLLTPTRIYMEVLDVIKKCEVHGLAHITGGGLRKLHRLTKLGFDIDDPLPPQDIFRLLQEKGNVDDVEMYRTFNMGMGFVVVLPEGEVKKISRHTDGRVVGTVAGGGDIRVKGLRVA